MKAIFWDFDGTLVHRNDELFCALREALQLNDYMIEDSHIRAALHIAHPWNHWETSYEDQAGEKWWDRLFSKLSDFYEQHGVLEVDKVNSAYKKRILSFTCYTIYNDAAMILEDCQNLDTAITLSPTIIPSFLRRLRSLDWLSTFPVI